jgi:hypothetical protein
MDIGDVTVETFDGREGEVFTIAFADGTLDLTLAEVQRMADDWGRSEQREPFSAFFDGPLEPVLPQRIWPLDHEELGRTELFLVPVGPEDGKMRYEAAFT